MCRGQLIACLIQTSSLQSSGVPAHRQGWEMGGVTALQLHPQSQGNKHPALPTTSNLETGAPVKGQHFNRNVYVNWSGNNSTSFPPWDHVSPSCSSYRSQSATGRQVPGRKLGSPEPQTMGRHFPGSQLLSHRGGDSSSLPRSSVSTCVCNAWGSEAWKAFMPERNCLQALQHLSPSEIQNSHQSQGLRLAIFGTEQRKHCTMSPQPHPPGTALRRGRQRPSIASRQTGGSKNLFALTGTQPGSSKTATRLRRRPWAPTASPPQRGRSQHLGTVHTVPGRIRCRFAWELARHHRGHAALSTAVTGPTWGTRRNQPALGIHAVTWDQALCVFYVQQLQKKVLVFKLPEQRNCLDTWVFGLGWWFFW